jgi:photolyase PhrII
MLPKNSIDHCISTLPPRLRERCRVLGKPTGIGRGEFVLYWMHHAVRGHENPALDVAIHLANAQGLPVLVYQGLGGAHRYNSDRHHTFIMQGAQDAHRELEGRGIRAVFHLRRTGNDRSPLWRLAQRAAAVIAEDFPAPPFPRWTHGLALRTPVPTVAVDSCCIVPMQSHSQAFTRAYAFRQANADEYTRRLPLDWAETPVSQPAFDGGLGFVPLDLDGADIAALCAGCAIDHGVPPVAHTRGGSRAGYLRWNGFRDQGLALYARLRNDAAVDWPRGVSRMSPYLHHGQVSPFRVAREASQDGGKGAEKFLDELLIWRELAHNLCFHTVDPERLDVLPAWARQTLEEHAADRRPAILDEETLARSCSGDELWDLAQASLRIHGELHNNLRMTWAKAIPFWRPDSAAALKTLITLNHRYALDGSDPNSYGGLLWALGLYDRPFTDAAVLGKIRGRTTKSHARRLDADRYRDRSCRPSSGQAMRIAVIGGGIAGLSAARTLHDHGHRVSVFEKSRGLGGRAATRRHDDIGFDHGAQYFTADEPAFRMAVEAWREAGIVAAWAARIGRVTSEGIDASPDQRERLVAVPGMSALGRHLGSGLDVRRQVRVAPPRHAAGRWRLKDDAGMSLGDFDALIVSAPAPQAEVLLSPVAAELAAIAAGVSYAPAWALMLAFDGPDALRYDGLFFDTPEFSWAARNASKPGRSGQTWVVHASPAWTRRHLDAEREQVAETLTAAFCRYTDIDADRVSLRDTHRWLYSLVDEPLQSEALWDRDRRLAVCGDWCHGARIEGAYLSGQAAAGHLLRQFAQDAAGGLTGAWPARFPVQ